MKPSLMLSSAALVTETTSADIQAWSLSSNQTRVPLLYMFSAMLEWCGAEGNRGEKNEDG